MSNPVDVVGMKTDDYIKGGSEMTATVVEKRSIVSSEPIEQKCSVCNQAYMAMKITYSDGKSNITPPRCDKHQTQHLTNVRMNNALDKIALLGNLKARLTKEQQSQIIQSISNAVIAVQAKFDSAKAEKTGFQLME